MGGRNFGWGLVHGKSTLNHSSKSGVNKDFDFYHLKGWSNKEHRFAYKYVNFEISAILFLQVVMGGTGMVTFFLLLSNIEWAPPNTENNKVNSLSFTFFCGLVLLIDCSGW